MVIKLKAGDLVFDEYKGHGWVYSVGHFEAPTDPHYLKRFPENAGKKQCVPRIKWMRASDFPANACISYRCGGGTLKLVEPLVAGLRMHDVSFDGYYSLEEE